MLELKNCRFRYETDVPYVLNDFSMSVGSDEIIALTGRSGCGKTTAAKIAAGYLTPESGSVTVDGAELPVRGYCPVQLIFQHPEQAVNPWWKAKKILSEVTGSIPTREILEALRIDESWFDRYPHELSGGEIQRCAIARVLVPSTRYIIADEMSAMLDTVTQAEIWNAVLAFSRAHGIGIIVISHDESLLSAIGAKCVSLSPEDSRSVPR